MPPGNVLGLMPHPERCAESVLGNQDGQSLLFRSMIDAVMTGQDKQTDNHLISTPVIISHPRLPLGSRVFVFPLFAGLWVLDSCHLAANDCSGDRESQRLPGKFP